LIWFLWSIGMAVSLYLWLRRRFRIARQWGQLLKAAANAEQRGDLAAAESNLAHAEAFAQNQTGVLWRTRLTMTKAPLARILFKSGQLERCAEVTFDLLQQSRAST